MLMIEPLPERCITALAAWAPYMGARRLSATTWDTKRGEASAAGTAGAPPALLTSTSTPSEALHRARDDRGSLLRVAHVRGEEDRPSSASLGQLVPGRLPPSADDDVRPGGQEGLGDAPAHAPGAPGDDDHPAREVDRAGAVDRSRGVDRSPWGRCRRPRSRTYQGPDRGVLEEESSKEESSKRTRRRSPPHVSERPLTLSRTSMETRRRGKDVGRRPSGGWRRVR